jgi:hypothetical protein
MSSLLWCIIKHDYVVYKPRHTERNLLVTLNKMNLYDIREANFRFGMILRHRAEYLICKRCNNRVRREHG